MNYCLQKMWNFLIALSAQTSNFYHKLLCKKSVSKFSIFLVMFAYFMPTIVFCITDSVPVLLLTCLFYFYAYYNL